MGVEVGGRGAGAAYPPTPTALTLAPHARLALATAEEQVLRSLRTPPTPPLPPYHHHHLHHHHLHHLHHHLHLNLNLNLHLHQLLGERTARTKHMNWAATYFQRHWRRHKKEKAQDKKSFMQKSMKRMCKREASGVLHTGNPNL